MYFEAMLELRIMILDALFQIERLCHQQTGETRFMCNDDLVGELTFGLELQFGHYDDARDAHGFQVGEGYIPGWITNWWVTLPEFTHYTNLDPNARFNPCPF